MSPRKRWTRALGACVVVVSVALMATACGGSSKKSSSSAGTTTTGTTSGAPGSVQQKHFANFRLTYDTGIDFLDPGLSYTVDGWAILWNVYLPLLSYKHVSGPGGGTLVPALATALPQVSSDGLTYKLTLRKGLKYSDGSPVKASDFR